MDTEIIGASPLETARAIYKRGDYDAVLVLTQQLTKESPNSAAIHTLSADAHRQLGQFDPAYGSYEQAFDIYQSRRVGEETGKLTPDMIALEKKLIRLDIILGNTRVARTRAELLAAAGDEKYVRLMEKPPTQETVRRAAKLFEQGKAAEASEVAREYLMRSGKHSLAAEKIVAHGMLIEGEKASIADLLAAYDMARRLLEEYPDDQELNLIILNVQTIASIHPKQEIIERELLDRMVIVEPLPPEEPRPTGKASALDKEITIEEVHLNPGEVVGRHGAIMSDLTLNGPSVQGKRTRTGRLEDRIVSSKSAESYSNTQLVDLFGLSRLGDPKELNAKIIEARIRLAETLNFIGVCYMAENSKVQAAVEKYVLKRHGLSIDQFRKSAQYLRYILEQKAGNDVLNDDRELFKDETMHIAILREIFLDITQNNISEAAGNITFIENIVFPDVFGVRDVIIETLPQGYSGKENLDTLALGLTLVELQSLPEAQKEYKLKELRRRIEGK